MLGLLMSKVTFSSNILGFLDKDMGPTFNKKSHTIVKLN